jgi:hypothetical protein
VAHEGVALAVTGARSFSRRSAVSSYVLEYNISELSTSSNQLIFWVELVGACNLIWYQSQRSRVRILVIHILYISLLIIHYAPVSDMGYDPYLLYLGNIGDQYHYIS